MRTAAKTTNKPNRSKGFLTTTASVNGNITCQHFGSFSCLSAPAKNQTLHAGPSSSEGLARLAPRRKIRRAFAQGMSDHQLSAFVSTIVSTLSVSTLALVFNSQQFSAIQSACLQRFRNPVSFSHQFSAQSTIFCKNLKQCFNCCSNNCFLSEQCAREAASP